MINERISQSIATFTTHVRKFADMTVSDINHQPTNAEIAQRRAAIEKICDEMDALAQNADSHFSDFENLRHKLDFFPPTSPEMLSAVADAFSAAGRK